MVKSKCGQFIVKIINAKTKMSYPEVSTCDGQYVVVQRDEAFEVEMLCQSDEVIGSKICIDGQELQQKKTWRHKGRFKGFKEGFNQYKQFVFCLPQAILIEEPNNNNNLVQINNQKGSIEVKFYCTRQIQRNVGFQQRRNDPQDTCKIIDQFSSSTRNADKKIYTHSLTVKKGEDIIQSQSNSFTAQNKENNFRINNILLEEQHILSISVNYIDFLSALAKGYVSVNNPYHLQYIPDDFLYNNQEWVEKCIASFMRWFESGLSSSQIEEKFHFYTKRQFSNQNLGSMEQFLNIRQHLFQKGEDGDYCLISKAGANNQDVIKLIDQHQYFVVDGDKLKMKKKPEQILEDRHKNTQNLKMGSLIECILIESDQE